jgi:transposase
MPKLTIPIVVSDSDREALEHLGRCGSAQARLVERVKIVLHATCAQGNRCIARLLRVSRQTVITWRARFVERRQASPDAPVQELLEDLPRSGGPDRIKVEQWIDIMALATSSPESKGVPITHWTHCELAQTIVSQGILPAIDPRTVGRFLKQCELKPHQVQEWMNRKEAPCFDERAGRVKEILREATQESHDPHHIVLSFDEKTGMQALERCAPTKPMRVGCPERREFEYIRHGTLVLFGFMNVTTGIIETALLPNRTNEDTAPVFKAHLQAHLAAGATRMTMMLDQLNTHMSTDVVKVVATLCGLPMPAADDIDTMVKRRAWLEQDDKPIVFCFTPKHASWLNPIETWFGVLARKILPRGSFRSIAELETKVVAFVTYFNEKLAHPYRFHLWKAAMAA